MGLRRRPIVLRPAPADEPMISSPDNPKLRYLRRLLSSKAFRAREGRVVLEGVRLVEAALAAGARPALALVSAELLAAARGQRLLETLRDAGVPLLETSPALFRATAETAAPQGVLAVLPLPAPAAPARPDLVLVLDGWRDPGNLGTALRAAAAAGADLALLLSGTVDPWHPRALRAGMGAQFVLPLEKPTAERAAERLGGLDLWIADARGEREHTAVDWTRPAAILVGGEAEGASAAALALPHQRVRIAMPGAMESLNAASAAAVLLFEALRQRSAAALPPHLVA